MTRNDFQKIMVALAEANINLPVKTYTFVHQPVEKIGERYFAFVDYYIQMTEPRELTKDEYLKLSGRGIELLGKWHQKRFLSPVGTTGQSYSEEDITEHIRNTKRISGESLNRLKK